MSKRILSEEQKERARQRARAWHAANPEKAAERKKIWHAENKEKLAPKRAAYYQKNKSKIIEKQKIHNAANLEKVKAYHLDYEARNKDKRKGWRIANRELKRLLQNNRRLKIVGTLSKGIVKTLMAQQQNLCNGCAADLTVTKYHIDHIIPVSKGGKNIDSNVQLLCVSCNTSKGVKDFDEWKKGMGARK